MRLLLILALVATPAFASDLLVFAAASTAESMQEIGRAFEAKTGTHVVFSFAGSSALARQIEAGAPADLFLSADEAQMKRVEAAGRAVEVRPLLGNRLVVVVPRASAHPPARAADLEALSRIALADPASVPAGVYARDWLNALGLWARVSPKVVPALDVRAALAAVETGAVPAGVVYATDAATTARVKIAFAVDPARAPRIIYPVARLAHGGAAAKSFFAFLFGPGAKAVFERHGFSVL